MKKNDLEPSEICTAPESGKSPTVHRAGEGPVYSRQRSQHRDPNGVWALSPDERQAREVRLQERQAEVLEAVAAGRVPNSLVVLWQHDLAVLLEALEASMPALKPVTVKGGISRHYKNWVLLVDRAVTLTRWLGLSAAEGAKQKPWTKLTREEQEREAERALAALHGDENEEQVA